MNYDEEPPILEELGIKPEEIWKKFLAILTQRGFKEVSTYEDMAGAIFVLFLFGILLLLVSHSYSSTTSCLSFVARNIPVWKHLRCRDVRMRLHLPTDQLVDEERCLR